MHEFLTIGEPLVVFGATDVDQSLTDATHFKKHLAGAELNVAVGLARLNHPTQYITQLGVDPFGKFITKSLKENNIATDYVRTTKEAWTGFQLKERVSSGDPATFYFRKNSAAAQMKTQIIDEIDFTGIKHLHLSGIYAALSAQSRQTLQYLLDKARAQQLTISFDPNLRPALWASRDDMIDTLNHFAFQADIVMPGANEGKVLLGSNDPETIANFYLNRGVKLVVVKMGSKGAFAKNAAGKTFFVPTFKVDHVIDTVGAGDGFAVGFISARLEGLSIEDALRRGNAIGALAVQSPGDSDGYPTTTELAEFISRY